MTHHLKSWKRKIKQAFSPITHPKVSSANIEPTTMAAIPVGHPSWSCIRALTTLKQKNTLGIHVLYDAKGHGIGDDSIIE